MTEHPIIFSGPAPQAILEGRKTQTRRVIKPQPKSEPAPRWHESRGVWRNTMGNPGKRWTCPYGVPGDRLWVREKWADIRGMGFDHHPRTPLKVAYGADTQPGSDADRTRIEYGVKWKPSIHMPRWASRITLEIVDIQVERLRDMDRAAAFLEGCPQDVAGPDGDIGAAHRWFVDLWDSINAKRGFGWEANPWVWVVGFKAAA